MRISVIVPVYNNRRQLESCVRALLDSTVKPAEIVVVDDGSTESYDNLFDADEVVLLRTENNAGPAAARNRGVRRAMGEILFFVDSDVVVSRDTLERVTEHFARKPTLAAVFGSYDDRPAQSDTISQFRNLLHHYTHQSSHGRASTFWSGCGAVTRHAFERVGGFNEDPGFRYIEDIELGYRLIDAGYEIALDKRLLCTHLKRWTLASAIRTDLCHRAIPWSRLILLRNDGGPRDLNIVTLQRWSVAIVALVPIATLMAFLDLVPAVLPAALLAIVVIANHDLYGFLRRIRGVRFALLSIPLHLLYFLCCGLGYLCAWCDVRFRQLRSYLGHA